MTEAKRSKVDHKNIYAALSAFQGELTPLKRSGKVEYKTKGGDMISFTYTPLAEIMEAIYPLLAANGLSIRHEMGKEGIEAILTHETYERVSPLVQTNQNLDAKVIAEAYANNEIRSGAVKVTQGSDMKDIGAAITYARRYSLTMVLGISSEEDTDAKLLEQSAQNAISFAYTKARQGINQVKDQKELDQMVRRLEKDLELLNSGMAPALGLSKAQYEDLLMASKVKGGELSTPPKVSAIKPKVEGKLPL